MRTERGHTYERVPLMATVFSHSLMALQLPRAIWSDIDDFLGSPALGQVCRILREYLGVRYVRLQWDAEATAHTLSAVRAQVRRLELECGPQAFTSRPSEPWMIAAVCLLKDAPHLRVLTLTKRGYYAGCPMASAWKELAPATGYRWMEVAAFALAGSSSLHHLRIDLRKEKLSEVGIDALAEFNRLHLLRTLTLDLTWSGIGYGGANAIASLKALHSLCTLHLHLELNDIGPLGAVALAELRFAPSMRTLDLRLSNNNLGDMGAEALAQLKESRSLEELHLDLDGNHLGDPAAQALVELRSGP